jgi:hypothetical protein
MKVQPLLLKKKIQHDLQAVQLHGKESVAFCQAQVKQLAS